MQGLGFLESGITDPLNHFSNTLLEFSALLRHLVSVILKSPSNILNISLDNEYNRPIPRTTPISHSLFARESRSPQTSGSKATRLRGTFKLSVFRYA